jgi:zinc/manganese transport system substrate-binding protein
MQRSFLGRIAALATTLVAAVSFAAPARAAISVVTAIPELAAITKDVGGNDVTVYSIAKPNQDYHSVEPRPSDVARLSRAALLVRVGMSLDMWMSSLANAAGNTQLRPGGTKYVDASDGIPKIEVQTASINGASGDVHPEGNPHYYFDPIYAIFCARNITRGLVRVDPAHAANYRAGYTRFRSDMIARTAVWKRELAPFAGHSLVTYHLNYGYFLRRFGIRLYGTMEPRPGIPPSARHISDLMAGMKRDHVTALLIEGIYPMRYPNLVAKSVGGHAVAGPYSVAATGAGNYASLIDSLVNRTKEAFS